MLSNFSPPPPSSPRHLTYYIQHYGLTKELSTQDTIHYVHDQNKKESYPIRRACRISAKTSIKLLRRDTARLSIRLRHDLLPLFSGNSGLTAAAALTDRGYERPRPEGPRQEPLPRTQAESRSSPDKNWSEADRGRGEKKLPTSVQQKAVYGTTPSES